MPTPDVAPAQALAFRIAGHHLDARVDPLTAIAAVGIQEYPPGHAIVAIHARAGDVADDDPVWDGVVTVNAMRGAPHVVPRADRAIFTLALVPEDDEQLRSLVGPVPAKEVVAAGFTVREALDRVAAAARAGLADGPLDRDAFHQALRERLPASLLPWCRGCESHHVRPGLWRALGPLGVTEMPAKAVWGRAPAFAGDLDAARRELVRRFLRAYGPATHSQLASWAQTAPAYAKGLFSAIEDELTPVRVDGRRRWLLSDDLPRLLDPPAATGIRVLGGFDPYIGQPDREALTPDPQRRKALFPAVGRPAAVLHDGVLVGLLRGRKQGGTLDVRIDWWAPPVDLEDALAAHARLRGCDRVRTA